MTRRQFELQAPLTIYVKGAIQMFYLLFTRKFSPSKVGRFLDEVLFVKRLSLSRQVPGPRFAPPRRRCDQVMRAHTQQLPLASVRIGKVSVSQIEPTVQFPVSA
jgi:hypothetical protein